jgi:hypothetical protein
VTGCYCACPKGHEGSHLNPFTGEIWPCKKDLEREARADAALVLGTLAPGRVSSGAVHVDEEQYALVLEDLLRRLCES